jgi:putative membrane protein insertion efficiency factor
MAADMKLLEWVLQVSIRIYQLTLSRLLGDCCRFEPSCSRYASACLHYHGPIRGSWLTIKRLLRCNPFFQGGVDLPPLPDGVDGSELEPDWERVARLTERPLSSTSTRESQSTIGPARKS